MALRAIYFLCSCILTLLTLAVDSAAADKPNIVLITLGSARTDRMGFMGSHAGLTSNLDRLSADCVLFSQAYSQAPSTVVSAATVLTGAYPRTTQASELGVPLPVAVPYLPDVLRRAGYNTAAFVGSNQLDPRNGPFQRYDFGFNEYDAGPHSPSHANSADRNAEFVVASATKWIGKNKHSPWFAWIQLNDSDSLTGAAYDRGLSGADTAIGKLLASLRSDSSYDEALIVVAALHGEGLGSHGEELHGLFLYDETIHVPLLLKLPKKQLAARQVKNRARLVDIAPTVLESAGIAVPPQMLGQSLLRVARATSQSDQPAYSRTDLPHWAFAYSPTESWRAGKYLYIRAPKPELYDLTSDPQATKNLAQTSKATLDTLASQLQAFDSRLGNEGGKEASSTLSSSEMQKLASLGYVGLQKSAAGVNAATEGGDPKDIVPLANETLAAQHDLDLGKTDQAISIIKSLDSASPAYLPQFIIGAALVAQQKYSEAVPYLHKAIELQPDSPWAHYDMGVSLLKTGDYKTAAVHLEIASRRLPAFSAVHSVLAESYEHLGRTQDAAREREATGEHKAK